MSKKYSQMKDTKIEWLKDIPLHWKVQKLKYLFSNLDSHRIPLSSEERGGMVNKVYDYYGASGVIDKVEDYIFDESLILIGEDGANLYSRSTPLAFVAEGKYWVNNHAHILKPIEGELYFWAALLETVDYTIYITGSAQPKLTQDALANIELPVPPIEEQQAIWRYLKEKINGIDKLLSLKKDIIITLEQQRQSIITEAVTKGLNPNVKMKDSGVEWIGKIPEHWKLVKIKHLIVSKKGAVKTGPFGSQLTNNDMNGKDVKIYNQRTVLDNDFVKGDYYISKEKYDELKSFELYPGDIVITTRGSIGKAAIVPNNIECGILHPCLIRMQLCPSLIEFKLIEIIFNETDFIKKQIELLSNSTTIEVIYSETLKNLSIVLPSKEEQQELLIYIENILKDYNGIICNQKKQVEKLKEYRQSLIYDAVTGKIDVRDMEFD